MYICTYPIIKMYICICTFLPNTICASPQASVDGAESLLKKHEEFEVTSQPHDGRVKALSEQANRLIQAGHYDRERWDVVSRVCGVWSDVVEQYMACIGFPYGGMLSVVTV